MSINNDEIKNNGELELIKKVISDGDVVFDVGANKGNWISSVLSEKDDIRVYCFEPIPNISSKLSKNILGNYKYKSATFYNYAISNVNGKSTFQCYDDTTDLSMMSGLHGNKKFETITGNISTSIEVETKTLDKCCEDGYVDSIDFLKIDTEGNEYNVLLGAANLLSNNSIKMIQFEYGGCYIDAKTTLKSIYDMLCVDNEYELFKIMPRGIYSIVAWNDNMEDFVMCNYFAVNKSHIKEVFSKYGLDYV